MNKCFLNPGGGMQTLTLGALGVVIAFNAALVEIAKAPAPYPKTKHNPEPLTLHPKPQTPNPKHQTLHPEPCALHPEPWSLNPEHWTQNPEHCTPNPGHCTSNPEHCTPFQIQSSIGIVLRYSGITFPFLCNGIPSDERTTPVMKDVKARDCLWSRIVICCRFTSGWRGDNLKGSQYFHLKAKARI